MTNFQPLSYKFFLPFINDLTKNSDRMSTQVRFISNAAIPVQIANFTCLFTWRYEFQFGQLDTFR